MKQLKRRIGPQLLFALSLLICATTSVCTAAITGSTGPNSANLAKVVSHAVKEGKDSTMNAGFARALGLSTDGRAIPMKVITSESGTTTNRLWVSSRDTNTIVIGFYEGNSGTFYSTDLSGRLKRAIQNDSKIKQGGLTNIPSTQALQKFEEEKKWWLSRFGND